MKGLERERNLGNSVYFNESYFALHQLCSFSHQIHEIFKLKPNNVLEVGIGNGFTSTFLRRAGINVVTADINPDLNPDIVSSIAELPQYLAVQSYDLVVCCEVLEHIPFEEFEKSIKVFRLYSDRLFLTIPSYKRWYGFAGFVRIPNISVKSLKFGMSINRNKKLEEGVHFWEVGSHNYSSRKNIKKTLSKYYSTIYNGRFLLNPYHEYFICS